MSDNVEHPSHYNAGGVETIEGIKAALGDGFSDYCLGNVIKYVWRCKHKGKLLEDLRKAAKYLEWAIEAAESNCLVIPDSSSGKAIPIPEGWRELEPDELPLATDMHEWMGGWLFRHTDATHEYKWHSSRHIRKIETPKPEPLAIPEGWRELEARETPLSSDMYEHEGMWMKRFDDANCEYEWYDVRHIRKIETANPSETPNSSLPVAELVKGLSQAMQHDQDLAWTWHCSIAMASCDEGACPSVANLAAARFMRIAFGVDVTTFDQWKWAERASAQLLAGTPDRIAEVAKMVNPSETPNSSTWIPKVGDRVRVVNKASVFAGKKGSILDVSEEGSFTIYFVSEDEKLFSWVRPEHLELIEATAPTDHIADANKKVPPAIPAGWRELFHGEALSKTNLYESNGKWNAYTDFDPAGSDFPKYTKGLHYRHIRKIKNANPLETPNSSIPDPRPGYRLLSKDPPEPVIRGDEFWQNFNREWVESENFIHEGGPQAPELYYRRKIEPAAWIPKVGDKVRVNRLGRLSDGKIGVVAESDAGEYAVRIVGENLKSFNLTADDLELIEAAQ